MAKLSSIAILHCGICITSEEGIIQEMILGHLGAAAIGYVVLAKRDNSLASRGFFIGSLLPDVDLLWWYFISKGATPHHLFLPHVPSFWLAVLLIGFLVISRAYQAWLIAFYSFIAAIFIHLVLDTHAGGIAWLYPLDNEMFYFFPVPNIYGNFVISAVLHWTFLLEVPIILLGVGLTWRHYQEKERTPRTP